MINQTITSVYCRTHGLLHPRPTGPACLDCALAEIRTADEFRAFCRSTQDCGPHQVPVWNEWAGMAKHGTVVSSADLQVLKQELYEIRLFAKHNAARQPLPGVTVR